jgi:hypothetical protein
MVETHCFFADILSTPTSLPSQLQYYGQGDSDLIPFLSLSFFSLRVAGRACLFQPQSKELTRGPLKLVQHFLL